MTSSFSFVSFNWNKITDKLAINQQNFARVRLQLKFAFIIQLYAGEYTLSVDRAESIFGLSPIFSCEDQIVSGAWRNVNQVLSGVTRDLSQRGQAWLRGPTNRRSSMR